jgi:hypothetical protein
MALPNPPIDLAGSCTAVYNNTLYVYSAAGFQSLALSQGASWKTLPSGVSVTGSVCVNANPTDSPAFYVVGGSANSTQTNYSGLQRFNYNTQIWESISPAVLVTQNRRNHGATFLPASGSIVVYAGSQDPNNNLPSSQTFLISTAPPYQVSAFVSLAPPLTVPMLMPWNESHALMVGGASDNTNLYLFSATGWSELGTALKDPIADEMTVQCDLVTGDDGSKVLQRYNMGVSPNTVTRVLLWANGAPVAPGTIIGAAQRRKTRRALTAQNWPAYNATGAPTTARDGFSIAQAANGYAIISGGSTSNPVVIFNEKQNAWVDNAAVFGPQSQIPIPNPSTTGASTSKPTSTSGTSASPSTSAATTTGPPANHAFVILGATLGAILGFAALIIIVLLLLRWHSDRESKRLEELRSREEKENRLSFADQGAGYMHEAGAGKDARPYTAQGRNDSVTSLQIMTNKFPPPGSSQSRTGHRRGPSDGSTLGLMAHRGPAGGPATGPSPEDGHRGAALAAGAVGVAAGAGAAMELSKMHRRDELSRSPSSGGRGNSPYSQPLPPVRGASPRDDEEQRHGRSIGGWSTYFADPVTDQRNEDHLDHNDHHQNTTFLHTAPSSRNSQVSLSEYPDTNPSRYNSSLRPLELNLGPRFSSSTGGAGRALSTSNYDQSHWSALNDEVSPRSSVMTNIPPIGFGQPIGNAFAVPGNPLTNPLPPIPAGLSYSQAQNQHVLDKLGMGAGYRPGPSPPPITALPTIPRTGTTREGYFDNNYQVGDPSRSSKGPTIRKMTGSEDMSWLNINAGR